MTRKDRAVELFKKGYNCAQSVFVAYADRYGMDMEMALKVSGSFGGGMGRMREVCGCVSGMFMVAGMETAQTKEHDSKAKAHNYEIVQKMAESFKEKSGGSIICRELLGLEKPEGTYIPDKRTDEYYKKRPCIMMIQNACDIIDEFFDE